MKQEPRLLYRQRANTNTELYPKINKIIKYLDDEHYEVNEETKTILLSTKGMEFTENLLKMRMD